VFPPIASAGALDYSRYGKIHKASAIESPRIWHSGATTRYVHTLLFGCPKCELPIAISHVSDKENVEAVELESLSIRCRNCDASSQVIAATAKWHYVHEWPYEQLPGREIILSGAWYPA
jgi:hypothetical protein